LLYILSRLSDEDVDWIAQTGQAHQACVGDVLIKQGGAIDSLMFVLERQGQR